MKINNQSPSAAPEKVKTRSAASKEAQEQQKLNGSPLLATKDSAASKGSKQQQQLKKVPVQAAFTASGTFDRPSVGGESSSSGGGGGGGGARTRRQLLKREREEETETVKKGDASNESASVDSELLQKSLASSAKKSQRGHEDLSEQEPSSSVSPPLLGFDEAGPQDASERFPVRQQESAFASYSKRLRLHTIHSYTATEQDDDEDDEFGAEGSSSSTASAVEDIEEEMDHHHAAGGLVTAGSRARKIVKLEKVDTEETVVDDEGSTTIFMTEEDYQLHQQHQQQQDEQSAMDEYDATAVPGGGNEDMEDTDGGGAGSAAYSGGNRLFRKKVKRKIARTSVSFGGGSSGEGSVVGGNVTISSAKAKVQMLHEFPTLFLGLRRNRMFLVTSLAQSFDLNQRDIILALRKIKLNESSARLGMVFGVDSNEVDVLVHTNVPKIADCLRNFILWPDDFTMKMNVPIKLRQHFNRIHLILNYLVVRLKSNAVRTLTTLADVDATASYCQVEQCHKVKFLIASTLDGCVCFVSRAFAFQTDDEQVLSQSGFLTKFKTNTNLIAGKNFHHFEDRLANGHHTTDHTNNNGGAMGNHADDEPDHFEDIVSEKISKSRTFKLKSYIENILENFQSYQMLHPQTCIDGRTFSLLDDIVVIVGALINLQKQEIE
ncbi:uncharacterized protein LOC128275402 isoform X2 [Anopheles cruzii]|nr:uncharacterized protein LOC128275402 isoform X2 [Anopheles cruzii]XP_052869847.1 uncharacterized protein LOC128275402 isoform X2 [Anopheles cruzii]XP_052869848.1 uncharacterized protein LOC128275402 isoform X2 [Anopheles cruzii]XP_052869849.1 uncharacterized protein LOC128275402 isoform X2 [Anopheles cruzii]